MVWLAGVLGRVLVLFGFYCFAFWFSHFVFWVGFSGVFFFKAFTCKDKFCTFQWYLSKDVSGYKEHLLHYYLLLFVCLNCQSRRTHFKFSFQSCRTILSSLWETEDLSEWNANFTLQNVIKMSIPWYSEKQDEVGGTDYAKRQIFDGKNYRFVIP